MTEKKTRKVRRTKKPEGSAAPSNGRGYLDRWDGVIEGIVELEPTIMNQRLRDSLNSSVKHGASIMDALDRVAGEYAEACKLKDRARLEYELYKENFEEFLEPKRTAALMALEEMKKEGKLKKTISEQMVMDYVRASWPTEYNDRFRKLKQFQAAVHSLEELPRAFQMRARALTDQKDLLLKLGAGVAGE